LSKKLKPERLMTLFEELAEKLNIKLVLGTGNFMGGFCTLENQQYLVVNKMQPIESRLHVLAREFNALKVSEMYLVPALREFIEESNAIITVI